MGMAASQARFLSLTARKTNVEWEGQQVNQQRTALANESANLYNQLTAIKVPTPPAVSDYTTTTYTFNASDLNENSGKGSSTTFSFNDITTIAGQNYVTLNYTQYSWDKAINSLYYGDITTDESGKKRITLANGLSAIATEYKAKPSKVSLSEFDKSVFEEDGTTKENVTIGGLDFRFDGSTISRTEGSETSSYDVKKLSNGNYQVTITEKDSKISEEDGKYSFTFGGVPYQVTVNDDGSYSISNFSQASAIAKYYATDGGATFSNDYFGDTFTTITNSTGKLYNQPVLSYILDDETTPYYISASENAANSFSASYYIGEISTQKTVEYPCKVATAENGRYKSITINNAAGDLETFNLSVSSKQDEAAYDQAMLDYEYEQAKYEKKIKDINAKTEKIQQEDRTLELRLKQLDTEQNAISTEMEAVSKVIEDNIDSTFKTFA